MCEDKNDADDADDNDSSSYDDDDDDDDENDGGDDNNGNEVVDVSPPGSALDHSEKDRTKRQCPYPNCHRKMRFKRRNDLVRHYETRTSTNIGLQRQFSHTMQTFGVTRSAYFVAILLRGFENISGTNAVSESARVTKRMNSTGKSDASSYAAALFTV